MACSIPWHDDGSGFNLDIAIWKRLEYLQTVQSWKTHGNGAFETDAKMETKSWTRYRCKYRQT